jgi:hypothetical protein
MVDTPDSHSSTAAAAVAPQEDSSQVAKEVPEPTFQQLLRVGVTKGLPFVAFGFFDNLIMVRLAQHLWWCHVRCTGTTLFVTVQGWYGYIADHGRC